MQLNTTIARQIVDRTMKIIKHSVNVMDSHGRIIGSGDPERLHQKHDGAILALNNHHIVEIDHATAQRLHGVKPGINLPIIFQQQAIGVVGISGDPNEVRNYGELVKMTAELIIEQAVLMTQVEWYKRHREELVMQLINDSNLDNDQLTTIAERLEIKLDQPRIATIIKVLPQDGEAFSLENLQHLVHLLEYPERDNLVAISSVSRNEVVVLKPITINNNDWSRDLEQKRVYKLLKRIGKEANYSIKIALGDYFPTIQGLAQSYLTAKATMEAAISNDKYAQQQVFFYQDHILPVLLNKIKDESWRYQQLQSPLDRLKQHDPRGILLKTLTAFFDQNCDLAQTCQVLHIHRNTLRYRLDKIEQQTNLKINKISDITRLYLAIISQS
ncbi:sugar diacid recognition domain-containing protein [Photobacterium phosphoreum]|uniref:sugar diacid recognition domain-containing protein n=1 Tax=Photobacterium phosphoreum TaxID=659 RepID=UPI000D183F86|nr:sugar diacid recognition domain-containing protein [Photobacterium phosphoreum]MCD9479845.1 XRE family transcriptional regulator [Photobacterium phosphoreum]MCD9511376.1 XRE family transcriptional regulator [Photobacterium phosphoreum]PSU38657.1 XRE family transcriptional regulator [Photobacterium phosphoreum]